MKRSIFFSIIFLCILVVACNFPISKEAAEKFDTRDGPFSVTVFPTRVVTGGTAEYSNALSQDLIAWLETENMAHGIPSESVIEFPVQWHRNQAKMFKESALAFSAQSKELHIQSDYALLVEILGNRHKTHVGGVHFFLINQQGEFVNVRLNNSHWDEYKAIEPKNETDGLEVAKLMMKNAWVE